MTNIKIRFKMIRNQLRLQIWVWLEMNLVFHIGEVKNVETKEWPPVQAENLEAEEPV